MDRTTQNNHAAAEIAQHPKLAHFVLDDLREGRPIDWIDRLPLFSSQTIGYLRMMDPSNSTERTWMELALVMRLEY